MNNRKGGLSCDGMDMAVVKPDPDGTGKTKGFLGRHPAARMKMQMIVKTQQFFKHFR